MRGFIKVISPGLLTTVQDGGRYGYQSKGIPVSGVMDTNSFRLANYLAGNRGDEAVLEMTALGGTYSFSEKTVFALSGADMQPELNGVRIKMNKSYIAEKGDVLKMGYAVSGLRAYLAVFGGIDVPLVLGSRSTYRKCAIGGFNGRELKAGDLLPIGEYNGTYEEREAEYKPYGNSIRLRVIPGPQEYMFTENGIKGFYSGIFTLSKQSDRMGFRLDGTKIESKAGTDIISDATVFGSVQITGSGQPIILMADRQTTGGYAKIATVISEDLPLAAQAKPGTEIQFIRYEQE